MLLRAEIKSFDSSEVDSLETWQPLTPYDLRLWINFTVGVSGEAGGNNFGLLVVSREALRDHSGPSDHALLVVQDFSWPFVLSTVEAWVAEATGHTWNQIALQLSRKMSWEYAGYR